MRKPAFEQLKRELLLIGAMFIILFIIMKFIFGKEDFFVVLRAIASIFWLIVIPGYFIMFYWSQELKFFERLIIGICAGTATIGLLSYYTGLSGIHIKYHIFLLPLVLIIGGLAVSLRVKEVW